MIEQEAELEVKNEEVKKEEAKKEEEKVENDVQMIRDAYMKELQKANIKDAALAQNLQYMMDMGYLNFDVNYKMLTRNGNDLVVAINKLCNNIVSDSIFMS